MTTTLTTIAATIRKHSPGALTESVVIVAGTILAMRHTPVRETDGGISYSVVILPDDIAEAVLRDAMVMDADLRRWNNAWYSNEPGEDAEGEFDDSDHGGSLGACHAAWRWVKGLY